MSRSVCIALLAVLILLSALPIVMTGGHASQCATCPEGDAAIVLWACLAVLVAAVDVLAGAGLRNVVAARAPQHTSLIIDRIDRPPHAA